MANWLYLCVFISSIFSVQVLSQEILWQKTFGGVHSEYIYDVKSTPDYGFLLAGSSFSNESGNKSEKGQGDLDYFLWKMYEAYFTVESSELEQQKGIRGKGAVGKQNVAVMAESTPLEDIETGKKEKHVRYFKARVLDGHDGKEINETIQETIDNQSIVFTDKSTSYVDIAKFVELHLVEKSSKETTEETLKWVHITIGNAKRNLLGNYHKIKRKYLQLYLNEFIYKLNRRYFGDKLFERLVIANITGL